ncbi:MAG TPA: TraB/GumN family protein [Alphaproteobacteria bacterium]|nr:TraB/GumN family protein [Alphaproteobacteria bacterium]
MIVTNHYKNVLLIGTSHIAKESVDKINEAFKEIHPDIICVELDHKRLHGLVSGEKPDRSFRQGIKKYGFQGYMFALIAGYIQEKLGNIVDMKPGSDMLAAVNLARTNGKKLELIDQDIDITLRNFSRNFTWKEKFRIVGDILKAPFSKQQKIDLSKIPKDELIQKLMGDLKSRYPSIHKVIVEDRNVVMAKNIYQLMSKNPDKKILAVIGAGHEKEILRLLKLEDFRRDKVR